MPTDPDTSAGQPADGPSAVTTLLRLRPEAAAVIEALGSDLHRAGDCDCGIDTGGAALGSGQVREVDRAQVEAFGACIAQCVSPEHVHAYVADAGLPPTAHQAFVSGALSLEQRIRRARTELQRGSAVIGDDGGSEPTVDVALPAAWLRSAAEREDVGSVIGGGAGRGWEPVVAVEMTEIQAIAAWHTAVDDTLWEGVRDPCSDALDASRGAWLALERHPTTAGWVESERVRLEVESERVRLEMAERPEWLDDRLLAVPAVDGEDIAEVAGTAVADLVHSAHYEPQMWRGRFRARQAAQLEASELVGAADAAPAADGGEASDEQIRRLAVADFERVVVRATTRHIRRRQAPAQVTPMTAADLAGGDVIALRDEAHSAAAAEPGDLEWTRVAVVHDHGHMLEVVTVCGESLRHAPADSIPTVLPAKLEGLDATDAAALSARGAIEAADVRIAHAAEQLLLAGDGDGLEL